jgi:hypothetical protein
MRARFIAAPALALLVSALLVAPTAAFADGSSGGTTTTVDTAVSTVDPTTGDTPVPIDTSNTTDLGRSADNGTDPGSCPDAPAAQTFLPWGDTNLYQLVSGGDFENGASGWSLSDGAQIQDGNEPYYVGSQSDSSSLYLGDSGSATSDTVCLDPNRPTIRFFVQNNGSVRHSWLKVSVNYTDTSGNFQSMTVGWIGANSNWQPVTPVAVLANYLSTLTGPLDVTFTFTPVGCGTGNWSIDDVYLDPFKTK